MEAVGEHRGRFTAGLYYEHAVSLHHKQKGQKCVRKHVWQKEVKIQFLLMNPTKPLVILLAVSLTNHRICQAWL